MKTTMPTPAGPDESTLIPNRGELTQERLKEHVHYDPMTGHFQRLRGRGVGVGTIGTVAKNSRNGYLKIGINYRVYFAHRLAWLYMMGEFPDCQIDHINGDKLDNRFGNLRLATTSQNKQNMRTARRDSRSKLLGAGWYSSTKKWRAAIQVNGKKKHLGYFDTAEEAHRVFIEHKRRYHPYCTV